MIVDKSLDGALTNVEKIVIATINSNTEQLLYWNIDQLAEKAFTTRSSVIKTLHKIGISGFKELKRQILASAISFKDITKNDESKMLLSIIKTEQIVWLTTLQQMHQLISKAKQTYIICGAGILPIASHLSSMLNQLGFQALALDLIDPRVHSLPDESLVIFLSNSGLNSNMMKLCNFFKKNRQTILTAITASIICNIKKTLDLHIQGGGLMYSEWEYTFPIQGSIVLIYICNKIVHTIINSDREKYKNFLT